MKKEIQLTTSVMVNVTAQKITSILFLILLGLSSCKKDKAEFPTNVDENISIQIASIPAYIFDWETATHMPSLPNANLVPMPWNSGTTAIDPNIVADYKNSEGWELVWNTFAPDVQLNDPGYSYFFALYNKYRGLLRFYLWQTSTPIVS